MDKQPTVISNRIELLDVYRGFAIFGIFVVNIVIMNSTFLNQDVFSQQWTSTLDKAVERILQLFFYTKFFPIFSLLFGLGITMQAKKMMDSGKMSFAFFLRRMFILFIIGAFHILFLWSGDVVHLYAIIGILTTFMIKRSNRIILISAIVILIFPFYDQILGCILNLFNFKPELILSDYTGASVNEIIRNGTYLDGLNLRVLEYSSNIPMLFGFLLPVALSMFLLGVYLGKNKVVGNLKVFILKTKTPFLIWAIITNAYRLIFLFYLPKTEIYRTEIWHAIFIKGMVFSDVVMGLFYLWLIGWIWYYTNWKEILIPLKYVGRMALTNYLLQSAIGLILFSSVGFSLYETLSPSGSMFVAIVVFTFQVVFSKIWLQFFKFGPLEWIWRCCTYKQLLPIRKTK